MVSGVWAHGLSALLLWARGEVAHHGLEDVVEETAHLTAARKSNGRQEGVWVSHPVHGHASRDLTSLPCTS